MWMLAAVIELDFRITYFKVKNRLEAPKMSKFDKARQAKARALSIDEAKQMVTSEVELGEIRVRSFKTVDTHYIVKIKRDKGLIVSCSCFDYIRNWIPCKHMYLAEQVFRPYNVEVQQVPDQFPEEPDVPEPASAEHDN
ncbi:hypothetical protein BGZ54_001585 [Gamsiella multidivaricata]|nr:hypothetical protein BGZ54_001585 [Gamsiella multidivaricata]